jgi:hypothetical protein
MPNLTPQKYRRLYEIYPAKACVDERATDCDQCLHRQIESLGRFAGRGAGGRVNREASEETTPSLANSAGQLVQLRPPGERGGYAFGE